MFKNLAHHHYINGCMGTFYRGILNYFADELYPFKYKVISTYSKAVEFFNKKLQTGTEIDSQILPAITLDPSGEFLPEERSGRFMWQYPNLYPAFGAKMFDPIYQDEQLTVTPVFTYFTGNLELICWLKSVYEYIDFRTLVLMWAGGIGRQIRPEHLWSYIVLPDKILNYEYENPYEEGTQSYQIDWRTTDAVLTLIRNMNKEKVVYPVLLSPLLTIENLSDASEKYGATDSLTTHKLQISIKYEIALPTFIYIKQDHGKPSKIQINLTMGEVHSRYGYGAAPPQKIIKEYTKQNPKINMSKIELYRIIPNQLQNAIEIIEGSDLKVYPSPLQYRTWNPIKSGRLFCIENEEDWDNVQAGDIIFLASSSFSINNIDKMRLAGGFISASQNDYFLLSKSELMQKPAFLNLDSDQIQNMQQYCGTNITMDPYNKKIYSGILNTEIVPKDDDGWGADIVQEIYNQNSDFKESHTGGIPYNYVNGPPRVPDEFVQFKGNKLLQFQAYYEFTETDINLYNRQEPVHFVLPFNIDNENQLFLVSYIGELSYKVHYDIDIENQIVIVKILPKEDHGIEMYFYN